MLLRTTPTLSPGRPSAAGIVAVGCLLLSAVAHGQVTDISRFVHTDGSAGTPCDTAEGLPCDRTPPHLKNLPDPKGWSVAGSGAKSVVFRRATARELRLNRWAAGTFLVEGKSIYQATRGTSKVSLVVPLGDTISHEVVLVLADRVSDLEFIERLPARGPNPGAVMSRVVRPTLFEYFNEGFDARRRGPVKGSWATMVAGDDGGFFATGLAAGFEFEAGGPGGWRIDSITGPSGATPDPSTLVPVKLMSLGTTGGARYQACDGAFASPACEWFCTEQVGVPCDQNPHTQPPASAHCIDNLENDGDGKKDAGDEECQKQTAYGDDLHPGFPRRNWESGKSFALFGEGRFCTQYATAEYNPDGTVKGSGNWIHRLTAMGWKSEGLLNSAIGLQGVVGREKQFRYRAGACWVFASPAAAAACNLDGTQCLNDYPYAASAATSSNYYNKVWDDVHHAMFVGLKDALHFAQVVHWGGTDETLTCKAGEAVCCGASLSPQVDWLGGRGASVVQYEYTAGAASCSIAGSGVTSAHEFGHGSGLDHNNMENFMHTPAYDGSALPAADKNALVSCVSSWNCPRPSGFRWINPLD